MLQAFLLGGVMALVSRCCSNYLVLNNAIAITLRTKNSNTAIRKIKKRSKRWEIITSICFWNADCARPYYLKFLIVLRVIAIITGPMPLLFALLSCFSAAFIPLARNVFIADFGLEVFLYYVIGIYTARLYKAGSKKKKK